MTMNPTTRRDFLKLIGAGAAALTLPGALRTAAQPAPVMPAPTPAAKGRPNILYILCDDLGIGDVSCFNPERGKITTPNIDRLAGQGMMFTDAHSASAVCTPTRYGIMTGRYPWRSKMKQGVLGGFSPRLIEDGRLTVPALLKQQGYATGCIGKWHLGMDWPLKEGGFAKDYPDGWNIDYAKPIQNGPTAVGFDYYFGISASLDMPPYIFIENDRVTQAPTVEKEFPVGPLRKGPAGASFEAIDVLPTLGKKAEEFIGKHSGAAKAGNPFFLYLPLNAPHTPVIPTADLRGKSAVGWYGDYVTEVDGVIGKVLAALDRAGLADNTLVFLTSDNGFAPYVGYITDESYKSTGRTGPQQLEERGHFPSAGYRGYKFDTWEGGHHIPLIARWPGKVKPGSACGETVCLNDLLATCAALTGAKLPENAGEDSFNILPALLGTAPGPLREATVHASGNGELAIRQGEWKLIFSRGKGEQAGQNFELYNLKDDRAEKTNLAGEKPEVVARLKALMTKYVREGRSTPGAPQRNTDPQQWPQLWWMDGYTGPLTGEAAAGKGKKNGKKAGQGKKGQKKKGKDAGAS